MLKRLATFASIAVILAGAGACAQTLPQEDDPWFGAGQVELDARLAQRSIPGPARNIILFIGDGMGPATVTAARILQGQERGETGEENLLSFERLPHVAIAKTYNTDAQTPDSAGTATTMLSGVKTRKGVVGVGGGIEKNNCVSVEANRVTTFLELVESEGWSSGVVSTSRITDATPAAAYGHAPTDTWEVDTDLPEEAVAFGCVDMAAQLVEQPYGDGIDIVLGGGGNLFLPKDITALDGLIKGAREDGRNLTDEWRARAPNAQVIWSRAELAAISGESGPVLGLFNASYMQFEAERKSLAKTEPSLSEMTSAAIDLLAARNTGYFLLVEGARIDQAHHIGNAARALTDTIAFADAVQMALEKTDESETLIIVTADHDHAMVLAGEATRGSPILGFESQTQTTDEKPYTTILYTTGPGPNGPIADPDSPKQDLNEPRIDLSDVDTTTLNYRQQSAVPTHLAMHGPGDVVIYAHGPNAELFNGVIEQNFVFHVMLHASGLNRL